jgi:competence protein ComFC
MHSESSPGSTDERTEIGLLLARFKYEGERRLARPLGEALAGAVQGLSFDLIVHVPSSRRSTYEPACELGRATARALRVRCLPHLLRLTRRISPQKDLVNRDGKWENVQGAFQVRRPEFVRDQSVLMVDDVYDSGATLGEAYRALKAAGAADIAVVTVTKTRLTGSP